METTNRKTVSRGLFWAMFAVLTLTCALLVQQFYTAKTDNTQLLEKHHDFQSKLLNLSDSLEMKKQELVFFKGKNEDLDKLIADKQTEIDIQKQKIRALILQGKASEKELAEARKLVAQYENVLADLNGQINALHAKVELLASENTQLSGALESEKNVNAVLSGQNTLLSKKVEVASLLPVANIEFNAVKKRNNGKDMAVKKAKNAEALRISFETGENKVLDPGKVDVYVRIINPKGETIAVNDLGSGIIQDLQSGTPLLYTQKAEIDWRQANKTVTLYWSENIKTPGVYKVELLQNGHLIGRNEIRLS